MIESLRLQNFRSYTDATFEFGKGVNIIVGPNASGKTNLLEALLVAALGNSYRTKSIEELIQFNKTWARLDSGTDSGSRSVKFEAEPTPKKSYEVNKVIFKRLPLNKTIPVVLFEPDHLRLLTGKPELRRDYLDDILEQTIGGYKKLRRDYKRAVAQRNALLKKGHNYAPSQLFAWNIRLSELGGLMAKYRYELVDQLSSDIGPLYRRLSGSKTVIQMHYKSSCSADNYSTELLKKLESDVKLDFARGFTTCGPHRDDIQVIIDGHDAEDVASRGETRTVLLALKIVELRLLEAVRGQKPLLLLDDVFSELDGRRRRFLTKYLRNYQTFITTTDADVVVQHFMDKCTIIPTGS